MFSTEEISPDRIKFAELQATGPPESQAEVPSFLFFTWANTDFMEGFAQFMAQPRSLLKKVVEFQ